MSRNNLRTSNLQKPPQQQMRTPQPSIKSSQMFSQQQQQQQGKFTVPQQQMQQQQMPRQQMRPNYQQEYQEEIVDKENSGNFTKMTVAQAITLITLRLGSIETKLMGTEQNVTESSPDIADRLDTLESKLNLSTSVDYKQQIDQLTKSIIQSKNVSNSIMKDNKDMKTQINSLKKEILEMKQLIEIVKNTAQSNENKIFQLLNTDILDNDDEDEINIELNDELNKVAVDENIDSSQSVDSVENTNTDISGTTIEEFA